MRLALFAVLVPALALRGQEDNRTVLPVTMSGSVGGTNYSITLPWVGTMADTGSSTQPVSATLQFTPGEIYTVTAQAEDPPGPGDPAGWASAGLNFTAPPGYTMYAQTYDGGPFAPSSVLSVYGQVGAGYVHWQVQMRADEWNTPVTAGQVARVGLGDFIFELGLGTLANGKSAGRLILSDAGLPAGNYGFSSSDYLPAGLAYGAPDGVARLIYDPGTQHSTLVTPQVQVIVAPESSTRYTISFYAKDSAGTVASTPYAVYTVEKPTTGFPAGYPTDADPLRITETQGSVTVVRDFFRWHTADNWTLIEDGGARREDHVITTDANGHRVDTVSVTGGGAPVTQNRTVSQDYGGSRLLLEQDIGYNLAGFPARTTTQSYYTTGATAGEQGQLQQVTAPNGAVTSYDYYDQTDTQGACFGQVKTVTQGWSTGSSTLSQVTTYTYTGAEDSDTDDYPASVTVTIGGTTVAKSISSYDFGRTSPEGEPLVAQTTQAYAGASTSQQTVTIFYRKDTDYVYAGRPYAIKQPSGAQQSFRYEPGTYSGGVFTPGTSGNAWRTTVVSGSATGGDYTTSANGLAIEPIYLAANQSTLTQIVRDAQEDVLSQQAYVYTGNGSFDMAHPIAATTNTWLDSTRQAQSVALNGAKSTWNWTGAYLQSQTDPTGIETDYTYDDVGRVATQTKTAAAAVAGLPAQAAQTTTYGYAAANRVISATVSSDPLSAKTTYTYDPAGRITSVSLPDGRQSSTAYAILSGGNQQVTETLPRGGTIVTTTLLDGKTLSVTGDVPAATYETYSVNATDGTLTTLTHYGTATSLRYLQQTTDWLGRVTQTVQPGAPGQVTVTQTNSYDGTTGLLTKMTRTGWADTYYSYNSVGQLTRSGQDLDGIAGLQTGSAKDRITDTDTSYSWDSVGLVWWTVTTTSAYPSGSTPVLMSKQGQRLSNFSGGLAAESYTADRHNNQVITSTYVDRAHKLVTTKVSAPGVSALQQTLALNGLTEETVAPDGRSVLSTYDGLGRLTSAADSRTGTTSTTYYVTSNGNETNQVHTVTNPAGGVTTYSYDAYGRVNLIEDAQDHDTRRQYDAQSRLLRQWGDGAQPVEYVYDAYGQRTELHTFRGGQPTDWNKTDWPSDQAADVTTFTYDEASGLLTEKKDADGQAVDYTYNSQGLPATRQWARLNASSQRVKTTYAYAAGTADLTSVSYNDGTPTASYTYNRIDEPVTVADATGTRTFGYDSANPERLLTEQLDSTFYAGRLLTESYETAGSGTVDGRYQGYGFGVSGTPDRDLQATYTYDSLGRINQLSAADSGTTTRAFGYSYTPDTSLLYQTSVALDTGHGSLTVTRTYDQAWDQLDTLQTQAGTNSPTVTQYDYAYNTLGQRQSAKQTGSAFADYGTGTYYCYGYDGQGQLTQALGYAGSDPKQEPESQELSGRQDEYGYDSAGNRTSGNHTGVAGMAESATANELNQLTGKKNRSVPVQGTAASGATILVESTAESGLKENVAGRPGTGNYWGAEAMGLNADGPAYGSVNVIAALVGGGAGGSDLVTTLQRSAFLAPDQEVMTYDADGNLSSDGVWDYTYDAENRLIQMTPVTAVVNLTGYGAKQLKFKYDYLGRRVDKQVYTYNGGWMLQSETKFVYAGWNLLAETNAAGTLQRTYAWGVDVAGSLTATGGIGALAEIVDHVGGAAYLPAYDGSGNVAALIKATDGSVAASYEYTPYGQLLREEGAFASVNPFRFSTHYWDEETGDVYYGYRYYSPNLGRFLNRDPIEEQGGLNLYGFVGNDPVNSYDILGMDRNAAPLYQNADGTSVWGDTDGPTADSQWDAFVQSVNQMASTAQVPVNADGQMQAYTSFGSDSYDNIMAKTNAILSIRAVLANLVGSGQAALMKDAEGHLEIASYTSAAVAAVHAIGSAYTAATGLRAYQPSISVTIGPNNAGSATNVVGALYGHSVAGLFEHGSLRLYPDNPDLIDSVLRNAGYSTTTQTDPTNQQKYVVFSAGPNYDFFGTGDPFGNLTGGINRPTDLATATNTPQQIATISAPASIPKDQFIISLINGTSNYNQHQYYYDPFPALGGYNSNSYWNGLLRSAGGSVSGRVSWRFVGSGKLVPSSAFGNGN